MFTVCSHFDDIESDSSPHNTIIMNAITIYMSSTFLNCLYLYSIVSFSLFEANSLRKVWLNPAPIKFKTTCIVAKKVVKP